VAAVGLITELSAIFNIEGLEEEEKKKKKVLSIFFRFVAKSSEKKR
jgi:hypothetical protein